MFFTNHLSPLLAERQVWCNQSQNHKTGLPVQRPMVKGSRPFCGFVCRWRQFAPFQPVHGSSADKTTNNVCRGCTRERERDTREEDEDEMLLWNRSKFNLKFGGNVEKFFIFQLDRYQTPGCSIVFRCFGEYDGCWGLKWHRHCFHAI